MKFRDSTLIENLDPKSDRTIKGFLSLVLPLKEHIKEMYLFGSRARSNFRPDSDYDILIVLRSKNREIIDKLYEAVIETLLATGRLVSLKIFTVKEFNHLKLLSTPFIRSVFKEGIKLGVNY